MTTPPIATALFLRRWRRIHRRETGEARQRHTHLARTLALASMSPQQAAIVTAYVAQVERAFCCDAVAEHVAASLRPDLFAHVIREVLFDGQSSPRVPDGVGVDDVEKALIRFADGKTMTTPRK